MLFLTPFNLSDPNFSYLIFYAIAYKALLIAPLGSLSTYIFLFVYLFLSASESAKALKFVKSCIFFKLAISGKFKEFSFDDFPLPNLISSSKFPDIALTVD